jgi:RimJ/RimL family protein N-acetyltransferase
MNIELTESEIALQTNIIDLRLKLLSAENAESIFMLIQKNKSHLTQNADYQDLINRDLPSTRFELSEPPENEESFGVFLLEEIIGTATLIKYRPGIYGLGYWIGEAHQGHGYMTEAVRSLITYARIRYETTEFWAGIKHDNHPSIKLVTRLGFTLKREQETHLSFQLLSSTVENSNVLKD